jgi:hypothetical protein
LNVNYFFSLSKYRVALKYKDPSCRDININSGRHTSEMSDKQPFFFLPRIYVSHLMQLTPEFCFVFTFYHSLSLVLVCLLISCTCDGFITGHQLPIRYDINKDVKLNELLFQTRSRLRVHILNRHQVVVCKYCKYFVTQKI